jgi:hypothetical protein
MMKFQALIEKSKYDKIKKASSFIKALEALDATGVTFQMSVARRILMSIRQDRVGTHPVKVHTDRFGKKTFYMVEIDIPSYAEEEPDGEATS